MGEAPIKKRLRGLSTMVTPFQMIYDHLSADLLMLIKQFEE
jgi:hypothetical protein